MNIPFYIAESRSVLGKYLHMYLPRDMQLPRIIRKSY